MPSDNFYENPILNSPYEYPARHWELDENGVPTGRIADSRRKMDFATPIAHTRQHRGGKNAEGAHQGVLALADGLSTDDQEYLKDRIGQIRGIVDEWRKLPESKWRVTPITARLLKDCGESHQLSRRRSDESHFARRMSAPAQKFSPES